MVYRKLRASKTGLGAYSRLYLAEDHILSVEASLFTERYYRFYFSEIQAIVVRRTDRGAIWSLILTFWAILMTTCSISTIPPGQWAPTPGYFILAIVTIGIIAVNLVKGPTCVTHIQTSIAYQKVGALCRLKRTEETLAQIRPQIRTQQGSLTKEQIEQNTVMPEEKIVTPEAISGSGIIQEDEYSIKDPSKYHRFAFYMAIVNAGLDAVWLFVNGMAVFIASTLGTMGAFFGIIAALIAQTERNTSQPVRRVTWTAFISYIGMFAISYAVSMFYMFRSGIENAADPDPMSGFSYYVELVEKGPVGKPGLYILTVIFIALFAIMGIWGLTAVGADKRSKRRQVNRQ